MGSRGRGAIKAVKPAVERKGAGGRPPVKLAKAVYDALREPTLRAVRVLDSLLESEDERTRLLAAKALVELGSKPPAEDAEEKDTTYKIKWQDTDYRVPSG